MCLVLSCQVSLFFQKSSKDTVSICAPIVSVNSPVLEYYKTFKHCDIILCVFTFLVNVNVPNTLHAFYCIFLQLYSCSCYLSALPQVINTA